MFQFPPFASSDKSEDVSALPETGYPIRIPTDLQLFAPPRGFSQLITSFIASLCQGIHHKPLVT
jgi:hypothetical protein